MIGEISVTNEQGVGTRVTVGLPLRSCATDLAQSAVPEATAILLGKRVLLTEDNDPTAMVVSAMHTKEGALVTRVRDGTALITEVGRQAYDLVISDMGMPVLSGLDAVRRIRANRKEPLRICN